MARFRALLVIETQHKSRTSAPLPFDEGPRATTLFVADVHLGKAAAFRAGGIAVTRGATPADLGPLAALVARTKARRLVVLGDFLHAAAGRVPALEGASSLFAHRIRTSKSRDTRQS